MPSLQKRITYGGDSKHAPLKNVNLDFTIPVYDYSSVPADAGATVEKTIVGTETKSLSQAISSKSYQVDLGNAFVIGKDDKASSLFKQYYWQAVSEKQIDNLSVTVDVGYFADKIFKLGAQSLELILFPKLDLDAPAGKNRGLPDLLDKGFIGVNKAAYFDLLRQLAAASVPVDEILLLATISYLTDSEDSQPVFRKRLSREAKQLLLGQMAQDSTDNATKAFEIIKAGFDPLYDFPLTIPEATALEFGGRFAIVTSDKSTVSQDDFLFYALSAEYSLSGSDDLQIVHYEFKDKPAIQKNSLPFSFSDTQTLYKNSVTGPIGVKVKGLDGSLAWSKEFAPDDRGLGSIEIEVPLQIPNTLVPMDERDFHDMTKKLRGQILELGKKCPVKDLTVVVQAKNDGDKVWRIVGAATTDSSGNFSMPFPFGTYTAAQALVSLMPNNPAVIPVTALREGNQTISDDFLYLLLKDADCPHVEKEEDCDCHTPKKASRLPDQADLIESDEYSQDIGGACVNLSNPNRTLSEFNYRALVRTSDPDVANYTLQKKVSDQKDVDALAALSARITRDAQVARAARAAKVAEVSRVERAAQTARTARDARAAEVIRAAKLARAVLVGKVAKADQDAQNAKDALDLASSAVVENQAKLDAANAQWASNKDPNKNNGIQQVINAATNAAQTLPVRVLEAFNISGAANIAARRQKTELETYDANYARTSAQDAQAAREAEAAQEIQDAADIQIIQDALDAQDALDTQAALDAQAELDVLSRSINSATSYELIGGTEKRVRKPIDLNNAVAWQDAPDDKKSLSVYQAVTIATGHILHYKSSFKADGYSLGELIYSLPLAPGQKKEIVVFDSSHTLQGAESQSTSQGESLVAGIASERNITNQLGGSISEAVRGSSSANTSGISAGLGVGALIGPVGAVLGVSGGVANSNSVASQDSSRDVSQFFGEKLRQSIMQNAEAYRQLNASVVTTVQEGQRYGVTSEVVANHNHCHALTMMYFEVLRHYAIFQELSEVEECVFVPLLMTNFSTQNIYKWRDVLAQYLLPMPSETYLQPFSFTGGSSRQHPLLKAFDANERIKTQYADVDFPLGSYDDEHIRFITGEMLLRVELERPKTRYDRIKSLPVTTKTVTTKEFDPEATIKNNSMNAIGFGLLGPFALLFGASPIPSAEYSTTEHQVQVKAAIFDIFMSLDANYESVSPAQCIRITNFNPTSISFGGITIPITGLDFFHGDKVAKDLWSAYASILGYVDDSNGPAVLNMLNTYFKGQLIAEWDDIFYNEIAPLVFNKIVASITISKLSTDFTSDTRYNGGERLIRISLNGSTSLQRNQLPLELRMSSASPAVTALKNLVTLTVENMTLSYSTSHYNGLLFSGNINDDLLDETILFIPENAEEKRNPKKEDSYLVYKLIEHLNSNLEYYNKVLWYSLDPDRRFMLLDGFNIQIFDDFGQPLRVGGFRSLASVVKNDLVTITGNSLVFPVAAGYKVSQSYISKRPARGEDAVKKVTLLDHYQPLTPLQPYRVSVPSKGVFAEAVQGACNACEKIETERLQDWTRFPNTDEPTSILPITTPVPAITDWKAVFKDFATPIVNIQNAPAAPTLGAGLAGLSELLGKSGVFNDITGLDANQQNVLKTYLSNQENAKAFASMAKDMAMQAHNTENSGKIMDSLKTAKDGGALNQQDYSKLVKDHLQQQIDGGETKKAELQQAKQANPSLTKAAVDAVSQGKDVKAQNTDSEGNAESLDVNELGGTTAQGLMGIFAKWVADTTLGIGSPFFDEAAIEKDLIAKAKEYGFTLSAGAAAAVRSEMGVLEGKNLRDKDVKAADKLEIIRAIAQRVVDDSDTKPQVRTELQGIIKAVATKNIADEVRGYGFALSAGSEAALAKAMTDADIKILADKDATKVKKLALLKTVAARAIAATADQSVKQELQALVGN